MSQNVQWLGVSFGKLLVGYVGGFAIYSITGEGRSQSKCATFTDEHLISPKNLYTFVTRLEMRIMKIVTIREGSLFAPSFSEVMESKTLVGEM